MIGFTVYHLYLYTDRRIAAPWISHTRPLLLLPRSPPASDPNPLLHPWAPSPDLFLWLLIHDKVAWVVALPIFLQGPKDESEGEREREQLSISASESKKRTVETGKLAPALLWGHACTLELRSIEAKEGIPVFARQSRDGLLQVASPRGADRLEEVGGRGKVACSEGRQQQDRAHQDSDGERCSPRGGGMGLAAGAGEDVEACRAVTAAINDGLARLLAKNDETTGLSAIVHTLIALLLRLLLEETEGAMRRLDRTR